MPIVDESKQNKGVNNNTRNKQMAIDMEYYNLRFKSPYLGAKYQQRVIPVRTLNGVQDVFVDNRGTIKQGGHTHSKLYNYSNRNRTHPIKGAYAREVDSWNNNTSPIKALVNSGIGYALAPAAQAVYDYTKGALDISKNPTKASNYLVMLPAKYKEMPTAKKISTPKQKEETIWERGKQLINLVGSRKLQLFFDSEPEHTSKRIKIPNKKVTKNKRRENLEIEISPNSYTINDTTKINSRRYRIPESINLTKHTFGYRNRGDYTPINSVAAPITAFSNFKSKESISPNNQNYIGIDSIGKFVFGKYSDIPNGSMISPTFKNTVTGFKTDSKDNVLFMESNSNGSRKSPILNAIVNGKSVNNRLNFLANNNRTDEYGSIAGGRIIIQAGKEVRLVSGSIDNIRDEIEAMKSRNNVKTVDLYTLDNGTYHSGLRTFDKIFTRDDLLKYDAQNTGGGNFYI